MKTEQEIKEAIETRKEFMIEDAGYLSKAIARSDWAYVIKKLDTMSSTAAAILEAVEILK
jgi:hypothetical protein